MLTVELDLYWQIRRIFYTEILLELNIIHVSQFRLEYFTLLNYKCFIFKQQIFKVNQVQWRADSLTILYIIRFIVVV